MKLKAKIIAKLVRINPMRLKWMPDKMYLQMKFYDTFGRFMSFVEPRTFNEKLQWLKVHYHKNEHTALVDKYAVKKIISNKIGSEYIIPTIGVWDSFDDIDFDALPNQFVLKCTHDSGGLVICSDKEALDLNEVRTKIERSLKNQYYYGCREWPYKNVKPRIIAEQFMGDNIRDYRSLGFNSVPRMMLVCSERFSNGELKESFYNEALKHFVSVQSEYENDIFPVYRPKQYKLIKALTSGLLENKIFSRIDFYEVNEKMYFGEITSQPTSRYADFKPEEWDSKLGKWIRLPEGGYRLDSDVCSIIIENADKLNTSKKALVDYKFFCFDGIAESVMVCTGREQGRPQFYFFDKDWNLKRYNQRGKNAPENFTLPKPECINEMFSMAEKLSQGIPYVRVDLYCIDGLIYFGEMTFYPDSGFDPYILPEADLYWGEMLRLPEVGGSKQC